MMTQPATQPGNRILAGLPPRDYQRILPTLEPVKLHHSEVLFVAGQAIEHVYFLDGAMVSLVAQTASGESVEVGVCGFEGVAGISCVMGVEKSPYHAVVQYPDGAMRMTVRDLRAEFNHIGPLHNRVLRYLHGLLFQTSQVAVCNRLHSISERLARWLLMSHDRCRCDDLPFTHEFLALMLGSRRAGVTEAAIILQAEGYIRYRRGHITILDRDGLLDHSCECYPTIKAEFDALVS